VACSQREITFTFLINILFILLAAYFRCSKLTASVEVAFSLGSSSSHSLGTYGTSKSVDSGTSSGSPSKDQEDQNDASNAFARKIKEQWVRICHHASVLFLSVSCSYV